MTSNMKFTLKIKPDI